MSDQRQNDLLNYYPDLSDQEEEKESEEKQPLPGSEPHKMVKTEAVSAPNTQKSVFTAPMLFGGRHFVPPPPPPGSKKSFPMPPPPQQSQHQHHYNQGNNHSNNSQGNMPYRPPYNEQNPVQRQERQRKNCLHVKNIPKHYNEVDKLMTFFKNEGQIKQIKVNHQDSSAIVRFVKEESAMRFINSKKAIFNRSFIIYSLNQKEAVQPELVKQRQNEEAGKIKKPIELEMRQIKQRMQAVLADKIRALLYCLNNLQNQIAREQLQRDLTHAIEVKTNLSRYSYEEIVQIAKGETEFDWTINYVLERRGEVDKKIYTHQLQKKFGPVSSLEITPLNTQPQTTQEPQKTEHAIKLVFMGPKQAWTFYYNKYLNRGEAKAEEVREQKKMQIEGRHLRYLFNEGIIKTPNIVSLEQTPKLKQLDELLELNELGEVMPLPLAHEPVQQPQVDHEHQVKMQQNVQKGEQV